MTHRQPWARRALLALVVALGLTTVSTVAYAYWTSLGAGSGSATVGTLKAPTAVTATGTTGSSTVSVGWTASAGPTAPQGYYVQRRRTSDGLTAAACGTTPVSLTTSVACSDTSVADGTYTYAVTAVYRSWTATSAQSSNVTVLSDVAAPVVSVTTVNGATRTFPYSTTADLTSFGGTCGTASGDIATVTPTVDGLATSPATVACSGGTWSVTLTTAVSAEGSHTLAATQSDTAGNTGTATGRVVIIDRTGPAVTVSSVNGTVRVFPYSSNVNVTSIGGTCGIATGDSSTVTPLLNGSPTTPSTTTCSGGTWTLTLATSLSSAGSYTFSATQTDSLGSVGTAAARSVTIDKTAPVLSVTSVNGATRTFPLTTKPVSSFGGSCGTLSGDSATVSPLIDGAATSPTTATCSGGTWTLTLTTPLSSNGAHTLSATQADAATNMGTATSQNITVDGTVPTVGSVTLAGNGGSADKGDTVAIQFSEQLDASTMCSSWTNSGTQTLSGNGNVTVTITDNGANDVLTVSASNCASLKVGSIALGANYVSTTRTFSGNGSNASSVSLTTGGVLTITLGTGTGGATGVAAAAPTYTPPSGLTDLVGNLLSTSPVTGTSSRF